MIKKNNHKLIAILFLAIILVVFVPQHQAHAFSSGFSLFSLSGIASDAINNAILSVLGAIFTMVGKILGYSAGLLDTFIRFSNHSVPDAVKASWDIMRNFVNMFFILALIIMAFGTIFDIKKYSWESMLVPFLIAALLVNFSFVIGTYLIDLTNGLAGVFLKQIGTVSTRLGNGLALSSITFSGQGIPLPSVAMFQAMVDLLFLVIFTAIAMFAMLSAALFVIARVVVLWFLLILSPIAWVGSIFPDLKAKTWTKWWNAFISWSLMLPVYLFFLSFAFIMLAEKPKLAASVDLTAANVGDVLNAIFKPNDILFYLITIFFMVYGLATSFKVGSLASAGVGTTFNKIQGGIKKYTGYTGYTGAVVAGLKEKGTQIEEKGVFGIGGAQQARLRQARVAEIFGAKSGAGGPADKERSDQINRELTKVQSLRLDRAGLDARLANLKGLERVAALRLKAENGWLDSADIAVINNTMSELGGGNSVAGSAFLSSLKKGNFQEMARTTAQKEFIFNNLQDLEVKKVFGLNMAESRELMNATLAKKLLDLYAGDAPEVRKKVEEAVKNNVENFAKDKSDRSNLLSATGAFAGADNRLRRMAGQIMVDKKEVDSWKLRKQILELNGGINPATGEAASVVGLKLAKDMGDGNVAIREEADYRRARPAIPHASDLTPPQRTELHNQIIENIEKNLITSFSADELKTPEVFNALYYGVITGRIGIPRFDKLAGIASGKGAGKPDRKKREVGAKIEEAIRLGTPMPY